VLELQGYSEKIHEIMFREMQEMGPFIIKKQCMDLGIDPNAIGSTDLPSIAYALSEVISSFGGTDKASAIYKELTKLKDMDEIIDEEENIEKKYDHIINLGDGARLSGDWMQALDYYKRLLKLSQTEKDKLYISKAMIKISLLQREQGSTKEAENNLQKALDISTEIGDFHGEAEAYMGFGYIQWRKGNHKKSIDLFKKAKESAEKAGDVQTIGVALIGHGNAECSLGNWEEGMNYFKKSLEHLT